MKRTEALRIVLDFARLHGGAEVREAARLAWPKAKVEKAAVSERGLAFADWFRGTITATANFPKQWKDDWAAIFDAMIALDGRTEAEIAKVCQWARNDDFWSGNFLSPRKLRQRKDGVMYFDRFSAEMQAGAKGGSRRVQPAGYKIPEGHGPKAVSALDLLKGKG